MTASEALRLGAMQLPATRAAQRGMVFAYGAGPDASICAACALGTIAFAVGITSNVMICVIGEGALVARWPTLATQPQRGLIPDCLAGTTRNVAFIVSALYESFGWSRERIADWLETVEASEAASKTAQEVMTC